MTLFEEIIAAYPELSEKDFANGFIRLQDNSDGKGAYIARWEYSKPVPKSLDKYVK
jgi:hypothetical protein